MLFNIKHSQNTGAHSQGPQNRCRVFIYEAAATHVESTSQSWNKFMLILHISSSLSKPSLGQRSVNKILKGACKHMEIRTQIPCEHKFIDTYASLVGGNKIKMSLLGIKVELSWNGSLLMGRRTKQQGSQKKKNNHQQKKTNTNKKTP